MVAESGPVAAVGIETNLTVVIAAAIEEANGDSSEEEHPPLESEHGDIMIAQCSGCGSDLPQKHEWEGLL